MDWDGGYGQYVKIEYVEVEYVEVEYVEIETTEPDRQYVDIIHPRPPDAMKMDR